MMNVLLKKKSFQFGLPFLLFILALTLWQWIKHPVKIFRPLSASQTGIYFTDTVPSTDSFLVLDFEYLYNGGRVPIEYFNIDGWPEVYVLNDLICNNNQEGTFSNVIGRYLKHQGTQKNGSFRPLCGYLSEKILPVMLHLASLIVYSFTGEKKINPLQLHAKAH